MQESENNKREKANHINKNPFEISFAIKHKTITSTTIAELNEKVNREISEGDRPLTVLYVAVITDMKKITS